MARFTVIPAFLSAIMLVSLALPSMTSVAASTLACSAQYQAAKTAGTLPAGQTWPQYWSSCNTQLKG